MRSRTRWTLLLSLLTTALFLAWWADGLAPGELGGRGTGQVIGTLRNAQGEPQAHVEMWLVADVLAPSKARRWPMRPGQLQREPASVRSTHTDDEGRFCFSFLEHGTHWVGPAPLTQDEGEPMRMDVFAPIAERLELQDFDEPVRVELVARKALTIRGRVEGPRDSVVRMGYVSAAETEHGFSYSTEIAHDGSFELGPLPEGEFELEVWLNNTMRAHSVKARAGSQDVVLRVGWSRGVTLRSTNENDSPGVEYRAYCSTRGGTFPVSIETSAAWNHEVDFELGALSDGTYDVTLVSSDGHFGVARNVIVQHDPELETCEIGVFDLPEHINKSVICDIELIPAARLSLEFNDSEARYYSIHMDDLLVGFGHTNLHEPNTVPRVGFLCAR